MVFLENLGAEVPAAPRSWGGEAPCGCGIPGPGSLPPAVVREPESQVGSHLTRNGNLAGLPPPLSHEPGWNTSSLDFFFFLRINRKNNHKTHHIKSERGEKNHALPTHHPEAVPS